MSYTFTIHGATTVDIPVNRDLAGYTLKIVLDKGGSAAPVEVTSGLVAGAGKVTLTIPTNNLNLYTDTDYRLVGTKAGASVNLQTGQIRYEVAGEDANEVTLVGPVTLSGPIDTNPHSAGDLVKTVQTKIRHDFTGSAVDTSFWDVTTGPGMTVAVSGSNLTIASGTTTNSTTILRSKSTWSGAYRVMFMSGANLLSQRIANTEVELRVTNAARTSYASWLLSGTTATTGIARAYNNGTTAGDQTQAAVPTTASPVVLELENFIDEVYYHSRAPESTNGRVTTNVKNRQTPDPNEDMYIEIVVRNLATAPASSTTLTLDAVLVQDISELTTEITAGRGGGGASQSIPVSWTGNMGVSVNNSPNMYPGVVNSDGNAVTTTNLTASQTYTQTGQDWGTSVNLRPTHARVTVMHNAGYNHGTLALEQSADNTTWRRTWQSPIPSDGAYHTFDVPLHLRYYRWVFVNGATGQTGFWLGATYLRTDGATDIAKNLNFPLTAAAGQALGISAAFTGPTLDLGINHAWDKARLVVTSDQATAAGAGIQIQQSMDGTNWFGLTASALAAAGGIVIEAPLAMRYVRALVTNGSTASTTTRVIMALVSL